MARVYKVCVLKHEYDYYDLNVPIKPDSLDIVDFKKAVYKRFPVLQNKPLHMFYEGKNKFASFFFLLTSVISNQFISC